MTCVIIAARFSFLRFGLQMSCKTITGFNAYKRMQDAFLQFPSSLPIRHKKSL